MAQLFVHASTETQAMLNEQFTERSSRASSPYWEEPPPFNTTKDINYLEIFPRNRNAQPKLLEELTNELRSKLREAEMLGSTKGNNIKKHQTPSNLQFQAHEQVFEKFIKAFPSYAPLLLEIKSELDSAIEKGVQCSFENVSLRMKLDQIEQEQNKAVTEARAKISEESSQERKQIYDTIVQMNNRLQKAEQRMEPAKIRLQQLMEEEKEINKQLLMAQQTSERLQAALSKEQTWTKEFNELSQKLIKPFTTQDEEEVFGEVGHNTVEDLSPVQTPEQLRTQTTGENFGEVEATEETDP